MASATTPRTLPAVFHLHRAASPSLPKPSALSLPTKRKSKPLLSLSPKSIDVSKEDKPGPDTVEDGGDGDGDGEKAVDRRMLEEKFVVLNTGVYECRSCGYKYEEAAGDPTYPVAPGLPFERLPEDWRCPTCGAARGFFESKSVEIAGFAQNQQFGLGANTLTSGQKALLIYGSLAFFFALFLSGYFLQ